jgi:hypothetical protein
VFRVILGSRDKQEQRVILGLRDKLVQLEQPVIRVIQGLRV